MTDQEPSECESCSLYRERIAVLEARVEALMEQNRVPTKRPTTEVQRLAEERLARIKAAEQPTPEAGR